MAERVNFKFEESDKKEFKKLLLIQQLKDSCKVFNSNLLTDASLSNIVKLSQKLQASLDKIKLGSEQSFFNNFCSKNNKKIWEIIGALNDGNVIKID